jgi:hypothetical protein
VTIQQEKTAAGRIVDRALAKGYSISVYDGEEYALKRSTSRREIMDSLQSTDSDLLTVRNATGDKIGMIFFVWGNSPDEIVCDCSDNPAISELVGF